MPLAAVRWAFEKPPQTTSNNYKILNYNEPELNGRKSTVLLFMNYWATLAIAEWIAIFEPLNDHAVDYNNTLQAQLNT